MCILNKPCMLLEYEHLTVCTQDGKWFIPKKEITLHSEIDNGSFGSILKASIGAKSVVLKRIEQENGSDHFSELINPILFELQAVSALKHPNIVGFEGMMLDIPLEDTKGHSVSSGFVFELCELGNVFSHIFGLKRRLGHWSDRLRVSYEVAVGMAYIHDNHFIHRDLNSQNVVLTPDLRAKICDFGTARFIGPSGRFQPTHIEGSPCAMSPEQFTGQVLTLRSDVWQMGVFLWEIFAMRRPWAEVSTHAAPLPPSPSPLPLPPSAAAAAAAAAASAAAACFPAPGVDRHASSAAARLRVPVDPSWLGTPPRGGRVQHHTRPAPPARRHIVSRLALGPGAAGGPPRGEVGAGRCATRTTSGPWRT